MLLKHDQKWTVEKGRSILLVSKPEKTRAKEIKSHTFLESL